MAHGDEHRAHQVDSVSLLSCGDSVCQEDLVVGVTSCVQEKLCLKCLDAAVLSEWAK